MHVCRHVWECVQSTSGNTHTVEQLITLLCLVHCEAICMPKVVMLSAQTHSHKTRSYSQYNSRDNPWIRFGHTYIFTIHNLGTSCS